MVRVVLPAAKAALPAEKVALVDKWDHQVGDNRWVVMMTMDK